MITKLKIVKITWMSKRYNGEDYGKFWIGILHDRGSYITSIFSPKNGLLEFSTGNIDQETLEEIEIPYFLGE